MELKGADPTVGEPSALQATEVFRQDRFREMMEKKIKEAKGGRNGVVANGSS